MKEKINHLVASKLRVQQNKLLQDFYKVNRVTLLDLRNKQFSLLFDILDAINMSIYYSIEKK